MDHEFLRAHKKSFSSWAEIQNKRCGMQNLMGLDSKRWRTMWESCSGKRKIIWFYGQIKINPGELRKDRVVKVWVLGNQVILEDLWLTLSWYLLGETVFPPSAGVSPCLLLNEFLDMKPVPFTINNFKNSHDLHTHGFMTK